MKRRLFLTLPVVWAPVAAAAKDIASLDGVAAFNEYMRTKHGFSKQEMTAFFDGMTVHPRVIELVDAPASPGKKTYWREYQRRRLSPTTIAAGVRFMRKYQDTLKRAEDVFGVPGEIITAILGVETRYGKILGGFETARALATLAFHYPRRAAEFRSQLVELLVYAKQYGINPRQLRGSYAGAFGWPQFLPGSARRFAVDFDDNGRANLFSPKDAVGSIGNFLKQHGWMPGGAVSYPVNVPKPEPLLIATKENDYKPLFNRQQLANAGVRFDDDVKDELYLLVDLENRLDTEYRLGGQNFYALTRYNKSFKYAAIVADLGDALRERV